MKTRAMKKAEKKGQSTEVVKLAKEREEIAIKDYILKNENIRLENGQRVLNSIKEKGSTSSQISYLREMSFPSLKKHEKCRWKIYVT